MPFPVYVPFYPGQQPNRLLSREAEPEDEAAYLSEAAEMASASMFRRYLPLHGLVVDAGCGGGRWLALAHAHGCRVVGVDWHVPVLQRVRRRVPAARLVAADAARLPLRTASVAAVISLGVVEHDPEGPRSMLAEIARVLQPGGTLLLSVPYNNVVRRLVVNPLYRRHNNRFAGKGHDFVEFRFSARELRREIEAVGLHLECFVPHDFVPPRNMGLTADRNMLSIRFVPTESGGWELSLPPPRGWHVRGVLGWVLAVLWKLSPWLVTGEILAVARKPSEGQVGDADGLTVAARERRLRAPPYAQTMSRAGFEPATPCLKGRCSTG